MLEHVGSGPRLAKPSLSGGLGQPWKVRPQFDQPEDIRRRHLGLMSCDEESPFLIAKFNARVEQGFEKLEQLSVLVGFDQTLKMYDFVLRVLVMSGAASLQIHRQAHDRCPSTSGL